MNQKRITNQILEQKDFTLNSTLNYLFNISNMKKLFSYLLISSMVVLSSCTNYDDQFDDLNNQINSLKSQIEGFSSLSTGLTALQGTVSSLQAAVNALPKTQTPATDISGLEASVAALQAQLANAATSAQVAAITADLAATQAALQATIASNATDLTALEAAVAALENTDTSALEAAVAELKTALASAATSAEITALETSIAAAQTAIDALENVDLSDLTASVAALENTDLTAVNTAIAELKAALALLENTDVSGIETSVAALSTLVTATQASIAANATAIGANATSIDSLSASLAALTATIAELKATLATVSTAEEVSDLAASLVAAQADLDVLLAQSSFYVGDVSITNQSELDFVNSLGNKVNVVQGKVTITQNVDMNEVTLTAVMSRFITVTKEVTYTSTDSKTTQLPFANLIGTASLTIDQAGDISLPKLASVNGALTLSGDEATGQDITKTVSLPLLTSVTGAMTFNNIGKATTFSLPTMVEHDNAITITIDKTGTVDLSAFTNATVQSTGVADTSPEALVVTAAKLTAPVYSQGAITGSELTSVDLPKWKFENSSTFAVAKTVVLPSVDPGKADGYSIAINSRFPQATSVHIIAAASTKPSVTGDLNTTATQMSVTSSSAVLETLILGGIYSNVSITGASDLTSLTFDGTALDFQLAGSDIVTLDIPYTAATPVTGDTSSFILTGNTKLTSATADKIDGVSTFTVQTNADLTDISFAALKSNGTTTAPDVNISGNDLTIENIQIPSSTVAHKITSADFSPLSAFIADAVGNVTAGGSVIVTADRILKTTSALGVEDTNVTVGDDLYDSADTGTAADVDNNVIASYTYTASVGGVDAVARKYSFRITDLSTLNTGNSTVVINGSNVSLIPDTAIDDLYDIQGWAANASTTAALDAAGYSVTVGSGENTAVLDIKDWGISSVAYLDAGPGTKVSITTGTASSLGDIASAFKTALDAKTGVTSGTYTVAAGGDGSVSKLTFNMSEKGSGKGTFALDFSAKALSGAVASTTNASFSATASIIEGANVASTSSAWLTFLAKTAGVTGDKTVSITGAAGFTITQLTASGIMQGATETGDDESGVVSPVDSVSPTNGDDVAKNAINYASKLN